MISITRFRLAALFSTSLVLGWIAAPSLAQEPPDAREETAATSDETSTGAPDDLGVVHSWALSPGDGTLAAGERPNLSYQLPPGGEVQDVVTLFNYSNVDLAFDIYATDAFNNLDGSFDLLPGDQDPTDIGTWVTMPQNSIIIPAGTQATLPITIHVPIDARPGDHAGAILASSLAQGTGPDGRVVTVDRRTGTRMYIRVDGPLEAELAVEDLSTTYSPVLNPLDGGVTVHYRLVNRGNVRLGGTHRLSVSGPFGLMRTTLEAEEVVELLPGESIDVVRTVEDVAASGLVFADVKVEARPVSGEGDDIEPSGHSSYSLAIPFTIVALAAIAVLSWYARRAYLRHRDLDTEDYDEPVFVEHQPT